VQAGRVDGSNIARQVVGVVQRALRGVQYLPCLPCLKIQTWASSVA
jgi:hypothetical protein